MSDGMTHDTITSGFREAPLGQSRVWVLDDSALAAQAAERVLAPEFVVHTFSDGAALLERLAAGGDPDALVLDWHLPGLSGLEVLRFVRQSRDEVSLPVLMLTAARSDSVDLVEALAAGANDFVTKPYASAELLARVRTLVRVGVLHARLRRAEERTGLERQQREAEARTVAEFEQQLIGIVSHDLRNPIAAISFSAATLLRQQNLDERQQRSITRIASSADRASRMIRDVLDFTQIRLGGGLPVEPQPVDLHVLARHIVDEVALSHAARRIDVTQDGDGSCYWDPDRVAQVVTNLLSNALKYSPPGSTVRVVTRADSDFLVLEVANEGTPIPADLLPRLFEPMRRGDEQIDRTGRSIGLGLYIVHAIVSAQRGSINVTSTVESGTCFAVRLPRNPPY